ncbi:MAG TPA: hypothetical protein VI542_16300 [Candidatus Tectomicrobia bacterium]
MPWTQTPPIQLTHGPLHHAFTSLASWNGDYYVAYRQAPTHGITPPGVVQIHRVPLGCLLEEEWDESFVSVPRETLSLGNVQADIRDPRLVASEEALYCICGVYQPTWPATALSPNSPWNTIQSYVSYTEDGDSWSPLQPVGRPGYWIWSAVAVPWLRKWFAAAYHTGGRDETSSIVLLGGESLLTLGMHALIYDGSSLRRSGTIFDHPHVSPAEPVLFVQDATTLGCCLRTETGMEIGVAQYPYQDWRWHSTQTLAPISIDIHPSAVLETSHGRLLVGREIQAEYVGVYQPSKYTTTTSLYRLDAQHVSAPLLRLPSTGDTGYAGLCATPDPDRFLISYYSQHTTGQSFRARLPGSQVFLAAVTAPQCQAARSS